MARQSQAWKNLERETAKALGGRRVLRGMDFSQSATDVIVDDFPQLKIDCKYKKNGFSHHSLLDEIEDKYCQDILGPHVPVAVLVTKSGREVGACVTMRLGEFVGLLQDIRNLEASIRKYKEIHRIQNHPLGA